MTPPFTLSNIHQHVFPDSGTIAYVELKNHLNDNDLQKLSSSEGKTFSNRTMRMGWHFDTAKKINGIMVVRTTQNQFSAWRILKGISQDPCSITAIKTKQINSITFSKETVMTEETAKVVFSHCQGDGKEKPRSLSFQKVELNGFDLVTDFFKGAPNLLPKFKTDDDPDASFLRSPGRVYVYAAIFLAVATTIHLAKRYGAKTPPKPEVPPQKPLQVVK